MQQKESRAGQRSLLSLVRLIGSSLSGKLKQTKKEYRFTLFLAQPSLGTLAGIKRLLDRASSDASMDGGPNA
jgi:hypothetical protein